MREYTVGFVFDENNRVALIRKNKPSWQMGKLNGIGGKIEKDELPLDAQIREFKEEAGVEILDWRLFCVLEVEKDQAKDDSDARVFCYAAENNCELTSLTDEKVDWYEIRDLKFYQTLPNLKWLIPMALHKDVIKSVVYQKGEK